jgi:5'-phosphate synthase pdxT subunit
VDPVAAHPRGSPAPPGGSGPGPRLGVLALQGDFAAHAAALAELGCTAREVRDLEELAELDGLVLPGGESTTLLRLLGPVGVRALRAFAQRGGAILGTCAGLILLAREVRRPAQPSLGLLDVVVERNAYGRQVDSFSARGRWLGGGDEGMEMVFIRAPRIVACGPGVQVLATYGEDPVLVRQGRILGATFHPELTPDRRVHRLLLEATSTSRFQGQGQDLVHDGGSG